MSSAIAVVGAGPGLGRAIARRFGSAGHPVALIARSRQRLEAIAASLRAEGITASVYPADVTDTPGLTAALSAAAGELGRIGVMSYSPGATWDPPRAESRTWPRWASPARWRPRRNRPGRSSTC